MRPEDFNVQKIVDCIQGTCTESIQSALDFYYPGMSEDDLTEQDHNDITNQVFLCESCGWWCESHEETENGHCQDCSAEDEGYCPECGRWLEDDKEEDEDCEYC